MTDHRFQTIVTVVENKPGVLARVAGLFARRGYNIESLAVAPTDDEAFSRITFVVDVEQHSLEQVVKQLDKLVNVVEIHELDPVESVQRELMMVSVEAGDAVHEVVSLADRFGAKVMARTESAVMLSTSDYPPRLDELEDLLRAYEIVEIQRTGRVALSVFGGATN